MSTLGASFLLDKSKSNDPFTEEKFLRLVIKILLADQLKQQQVNTMPSNNNDEEKNMVKEYFDWAWKIIICIVSILVVPWAWDKNEEISELNKQMTALRLEVSEVSVNTRQLSRDMDSFLAELNKLHPRAKGQTQD